MTPLQFDREELRRDFSRLGWALIASELLLVFASLAGSLLFGGLLRLFSPMRRTWQMIEGYIILGSALVGTLPMLALGVEDDRLNRLFDERERIWPVQAAFYFLLVLGLQKLVPLVCAPLVHVLEQLGCSFGAASSAATGFSDSHSMLLYSVAVAPLCEELVYRGALLRYLERYGRWFAITMSALVFALMHGNAVQFPVAFVIGMVFAYLALRYSIRLSILLHVLNNLFVEVIGRLEVVNETLGRMVNGAFLCAGVLALVLMAVSGGRTLVRDIRRETTPREVYRAFFTSGPMAAVFLYMAVLTIASVTA